ncbi:helix-turn-helix domain-containing protein [Kribbella sp. NPDC049227]|uniref:helix-turn-helix domain-containing protein n=1 Tax=Kribbella sp. NPDC049227 TaxID=3364113 RepID=UPI0037228A46
MTGVEIWDDINETLAAIKWPVVVVLGGWFLRRELAGLVRRLLKIEAAGATVEFDAKQETLVLGAEVSESGERVVNSAIGVQRVTSYADGLVSGSTPAEHEPHPAQQANGEAKPDSTDTRLRGADDRQSLQTLREDLVTLIEASFQSGFVAGVGAEPGGGIPRPTVRWSGSEPRITGWEYESGNAALRELVGARLRKLREAAGISRSDAGWSIRSSESKVARIERGLTGVRGRDVEDLLTLYGMTEQTERAELVRLAEAARGAAA